MKNLKLILKHQTLFYCLCISLFFISCSDSEDPSSATASLLTNSWDVVKFQRKLPSETEWTDPSSNSCNLDDTWEFSSSGNVTIYNGSVLCDGTLNSDTFILGFELAANDTKIIFNLDGFEYEEDIEELTEDTLITTYAIGTTDNAEGRRIFTVSK